MSLQTNGCFCLLASASALRCRTAKHTSFKNLPQHKEAAIVWPSGLGPRRQKPARQWPKSISNAAGLCAARAFVRANRCRPEPDPPFRHALTKAGIIPLLPSHSGAALSNLTFACCSDFALPPRIKPSCVQYFLQCALRTGTASCDGTQTTGWLIFVPTEVTSHTAAWKAGVRQRFMMPDSVSGPNGPAAGRPRSGGAYAVIVPEHQDPPKFASARRCLASFALVFQSKRSSHALYSTARRSFGESTSPAARECPLPQPPQPVDVGIRSQVFHYFNAASMLLTSADRSLSSSCASFLTRHATAGRLLTLDSSSRDHCGSPLANERRNSLWA